MTWAGRNRNDYVFADGSSEHFNSAAMEWDDKRYPYGKNLELYSQGELGAPFVDEIDDIIDTEAGLRYKLNSWGGADPQGRVGQGLRRTWRYQRAPLRDRPGCGLVRLQRLSTPARGRDFAGKKRPGKVPGQ